MENTAAETDITLEHSTPVEVAIQDNLNGYYHDQDKINDRLLELDDELDIETFTQTGIAALTIAGLILALTTSKKWLALPLAISVIALANIARGNNNLSAFLRKPKFRTRAEIEKERYALKAIRGDFKYLLDVPNAVWNAVNK